MIGTARRVFKMKESIWDVLETSGWDKATVRRRFYRGLEGSIHYDDLIAYRAVVTALLDRPELMRRLLSRISHRKALKLAG